MNILLVDDERLAVEVMNRMIDKEKYGFSTIYKALSMKQAQQICEETDIDIIICDIEMPRGSGLDFVQWLLDTGRNPIVIFLTSHAVFSYAQQAVSLGVQDYLLKPVEPEDMNQALEKAIRNAKSRKKSILKEEKIRKLNEGVQSAEKNVEKVKTYIETHFKEELTRESLASEVFMNPDYLSKLFKKNTGSSLMDYVTKVRIERAKELLERTVLTISEIAIETGYSNTAYFTKMFGVYGKTIDYKGGYYGIGILSRYPYIDTKKTFLPWPNKAHERRALLEGLFEIGEDTICFASTHLDYQLPKTREAQTAFITEHFNDYRYPVVLGGDFNTAPSSKEIKYNMLENWFLATDYGFTVPAWNPKRKIDYIFARPKQGWKIVRTQTVQSVLSDHLPIVTELEYVKY